VHPNFPNAKIVVDLRRAVGKYLTANGNYPIIRWRFFMQQGGLAASAFWRGKPGSKWMPAVMFFQTGGKGQLSNEQYKAGRGTWPAFLLVRRLIAGKEHKYWN